MRYEEVFPPKSFFPAFFLSPLLSTCAVLLQQVGRLTFFYSSCYECTASSQF